MVALVNKNQNFFQNVYEVVKLVPYGRVTSYGAIATYLGAKSSSRMVGWAMNQAHSLEDKIPAHRVVNRNGLLTGSCHFVGESMSELLEKEGIKIDEIQVVNFKVVFWDPNIELMV